MAIQVIVGPIANNMLNKYLINCRGKTSSSMQTNVYLWI